MNDEDLFKKLAESLNTDGFSVKSDTSYKSVSDSFNDTNTNSNVVEVKHPKTLFEMRDALERMKVLRKKREESKVSTMDDEETELLGFLTSGIVLSEIPKHNEIMGAISSFLVSNGFDEEFVFDNLKNMEGRVLPVEVLNGGKAQALRDHIDLELDFFDFDSEGKVIGISKDKEELYRHVVTHEFFHKLSSYKNGNNDVMVAGDALIEGFTDYFAKLALGGSKIESDLYSFPVSVCEMFTEIIGIDKSLDDYVRHTGEFPNLKSLFLECGLDKESFSEFSTGLSSVIVSVRRDKEAGLPKSEWGKDEKMDTLSFLKENIIVPYCRNNPEQADRILNKFNNLFGASGYSCTMEEVNEDKKI